MKKYETPEIVVEKVESTNALNFSAPTDVEFDCGE